MKVHVIDLNFFTPGTIAAYLVEENSDLLLIETGPDSVFQNLVKSLKELGLAPRDIKHVFVTHIHLDHAGAAWHFAESGSKIYVHPNGARHLENPEKLLISAEKIYKDKMKYLWGSVKPIPGERIWPTSDGEEIWIGDINVKVVDTQGHASHHNTYLIQGNAFTGDVGGVRINRGPILPPTPPPDINIEVWLDSIRKIRLMNPDAIYPTHFGESNDVGSYLDELESRLLDWTEWIGKRLREGKNEEQITPEFEHYVVAALEQAGLTGEEIEAYRNADPFWMNVAGLVRYWRKHRLVG
ncbi:MAG: MBL fold metallo-hydrolase [Bacteroidetes bacterium]|nr:MBL fold metallo-hydrolase [Bacteroidota bacterium]